jgi:hypothetical protein
MRVKRRGKGELTHKKLRKNYTQFKLKDNQIMDLGIL